MLELARDERQEDAPAPPCGLEDADLAARPPCRYVEVDPALDGLLDVVEEAAAGVRRR